MTIISLHLPKTAGTSFGACLAGHFGERYKDDYGDQVISRPVETRHQQALLAGRVLTGQGLGEIECVHGHFLPVKYLPLSTTRDLTFITWMREPMARMFSHYYYWQQTYDERTAAPHHRQVIEEGWTLERFCLSEQFRNIYTQYLWEFPLESFDFIGICEYFQQDLQEFSQRYLSTRFEPRHFNATRCSKSRGELDPEFLQEVRNFHAEDIELYATALRVRQSRCDESIEQKIA